MEAISIEQKFLRFGAGFCFLITIGIAVLLRIYPLIRPQELHFPYVIDPDSARFVRQAQFIVENGRLDEVDFMRWQPIGRREASQLTLHSYLLAYLYRIARLFFPQSRLEFFAAIFPVLVSTLCWVLLYLVLKQLLDGSVALIALNMIVVMPLMVARSVAGYADRDVLSLLLGLGIYFFYLRATRHQSHVRFGYQLISGSLAGILALTWHGVGLFLAVILLTEWLKLVFVGYRRADSIAYVLWVVPYLFCLLLKRGVYFQSVRGFTLLAFAPALFLAAILIYEAIATSERLTNFVSLQGRVSIGTSISLVFLVGIGISALFIFANRYAGHFDIPSRMLGLLKPFGSSRLAKTILELMPSNFQMWMVWPGMFFLAIIAGASLIVSRLADNLQLERWVSITFFQLVIAGITYTELVPKQLASAAKWSEYLYGLCLLAVPFAVLFAGILSWKSQKPVHLDAHAVFLLCWLFVTLVCARGGIRFHFFFIPVAIPIGVYALSTLLRYLVGSRWKTVEMCMVLALIVSELWAISRLPF